VRVCYAGFRVAPQRKTISRTRNMHASVRGASACIISAILQVSGDNISRVEGVLRRTGSRTRIHTASSGGHDLPMEEGPTWLSPKSIATSAGRICSFILCISISHTCLALYIAVSICWNCLCTEAMCGRPLPIHHASSSPAKRSNCCRSVRCYHASPCQQLTMVRTVVSILAAVCYQVCCQQISMSCRQRTSSSLAPRPVA
jgi:hypothetical protein